MGDYILMHGDMAMFDSVFGAALLMMPNPGILKGSGPGTINGQAMCVQGDERKVKKFCTYTTAAFPQIGTGILEIVGLAGDQIATITKSGDKPVLLKGSTFQAQFKVLVKAQSLAKPPVPDMTPMYPGMGHFVTTNDFFQGT